MGVTDNAGVAVWEDIFVTVLDGVSDKLIVEV